MSNEELLVAIKGIVENTLEEKLEQKLEETLERKFDEKLSPINQKIEQMDMRLGNIEQRMDGIEQRMDNIEQRMDSVEREVLALRLDNENVIKPQLRLLAENYVPAAKKYEKAVDEMEQVKFDVDILKNVVENHSETLQKIS